MPPELDAEIRRLLCRCCPNDTGVFSRTRYWHGSRPEYSVVHRDEGGMTAHVGIVVRDVLVDGHEVRIAGIQNLAVAPDVRGKGLASELMRAAMREAQTRGIPFGLLFCLPSLDPFYARLGWRRIEAEVTMLDETGRRVPIPGKNIAMVDELDRTPFPDGPMFLNGADW